MIVRFTRRAEADLEEILDYLGSRSPEGAARVAGALRRAIAVIAEHPRGGARTRLPEVLVKVVPNYRYKIFYRLGEDFIDVLHIRHSARRPWII